MITSVLLILKYFGVIAQKTKSQQLQKKSNNMYPNGEGIIASDDMGNFQVIRFKK